MCVEPRRASLLAPGFRCEGRFSEDGKFYACKVLERTDHGVRVEFTLDGTIEELPLQYLRGDSSARDEDDEGAKTETGARSGAEAVTKAEAEKELGAGVLPTFIAARAFNGLKEGYEFKKGDLGMGYYKSSTADAELQGNCDSVGHGNGKGGASVPSIFGSAGWRPKSAYQNTAHHGGTALRLAREHARQNGGAAIVRERGERTDAHALSRRQTAWTQLSESSLWMATLAKVSLGSCCSIPPTRSFGERRRRQQKR